LQKLAAPAAAYNQLHLHGSCNYAQKYTISHMCNDLSSQLLMISTKLCTVFYTNICLSDDLTNILPVSYRTKYINI